VTGFLLVVMGVGGCIGVATMFLLGRDEPATSPGGSPRADVLARIAPPGVAPLAPAVRTSPAGDDGDWSPDAGDGGAVLAPARPRKLRPLEGEPYRPAPWWQRLRSALGIVLIAFTLGALTAAAIGIVGFLLFTLLRGAVG
jgi:hypothetical protein